MPAIDRLSGQHLIAGTWVATETTFSNAPLSGHAATFSVGTPELVDQAARAAAEAAEGFAALSRSQRAAFLRCIGAEIDKRGSDITEIGCDETGLPAARLEGERGRTVGQLALFADHIENGAYLGRRHDTALPDRTPVSRPDLRMIQIPIGPVAVFGASNFPLAFSVAGGDTASALAAGCPVVVKGHSAHPGTSEIVAQAIHAATEACGLAPGVFSLIQGGARDVGTALAQHPEIRAVGFTGSLRGGRALFDLCAARPEPIPFYGELGSVNPSFVFPHALAARGDDIAKGWAASLTLGAGQFCTNPGIVVLPKGEAATAFAEAARTALIEVSAQEMLTDSIATSCHEGTERLARHAGVTTLLSDAPKKRQASPALFRTDASTFRESPDLAEEVFGPTGLIVEADSIDEMLRLAKDFDGQLTASLHVESEDTKDARKIVPILSHMAGRVLANGFPTGVEVCDAMVHGGPYPASTNFGATSVGTLAIRRWLRPVCYQNIPEALLPKELL